MPVSWLAYEADDLGSAAMDGECGGDVTGDRGQRSQQAARYQRPLHLRG